MTIQKQIANNLLADLETEIQIRKLKADDVVYHKLANDLETIIDFYIGGKRLKYFEKISIRDLQKRLLKQKTK